MQPAYKGRSNRQIRSNKVAVKIVNVEFGLINRVGAQATLTSGSKRWWLN